jgi:hypothetical protein
MRCTLWTALLLWLTPLAEALHHHPGVLRRPMRRTSVVQMSVNLEALCDSLQQGESPAELNSLLTTKAGARDFFKHYLDVESSEAPPGALIDSLLAAELDVLNSILMNLVAGAAAGSERKCARARALVDALWAGSAEIRMSHAALTEVISVSLGSTVRTQQWDQNFEFQKEEWSGILVFANYGDEQNELIRDALALCGGSDGGDDSSDS